MILGLLKSFFLHLLIVGLFIYGAEFFKSNKRFEINEIPLDIVDISDQTITKSEKKVQKQDSKKKEQQNKSGFQPPKVKSKPNLQNLLKKTMSQKRKKKKLKMIQGNENRKNELIASLNLLKKLNLKGIINKLLKLKI